MFETIKKEEKPLEEIIVEMANDPNYITGWSIDDVNLAGKRLTRFVLLSQDMFLLQINDGTQYIAHLSKLMIMRTPK